MKLRKLDSIRGAAAVYVMCSHIVLDSHPNQIIKFLFSFGQEAVIAFFLLSGFVIFYSYHRKKVSFLSYLIKRVKRIYIPLVFAYLLSIVVALLNQNIERFSLIELLGNILMLQDIEAGKPGNWFKPFMGNGPLWSLSYEWYFYMLFPLVVFLFKARSFKIDRVYIITLFSFIFWMLYLFLPNHISLVLSYFAIWWIGAELAFMFIHKIEYTFQNIKNLNYSLLFIMFSFALPFFMVDNINWHRLGHFPIINLRHILAAIVFLNIGVLWSKLDFKWFKVLIGPFSIVAPISYALYIVHRPILKLELLTEEPYYIQILIKLPIIFLIAYIIERIIVPLFNNKKNILL